MAKKEAAVETEQKIDVKQVIDEHVAKAKEALNQFMS